MCLPLCDGAGPVTIGEEQNDRIDAAVPVNKMTEPVRHVAWGGVVSEIPDDRYGALEFCPGTALTLYRTGPDKQ